MIYCEPTARGVHTFFLIVNGKEYVHFMPLLFSQAVCILRLVQQLSDIQNSSKYFNDKQYKLWKLSKDCRQAQI